MATKLSNFGDEHSWLGASLWSLQLSPANGTIDIF